MVIEDPGIANLRDCRRDLRTSDHNEYKHLQPKKHHRTLGRVGFVVAGIGIDHDDHRAGNEYQQQRGNHGRSTQPGADVLDKNRIVGEIKEFKHIPSSFVSSKFQVPSSKPSTLRVWNLELGTWNSHH